MTSSVTLSSRSKASTVDDAIFSMVVAIDIGTSQSGYAYCNRRELEENKENVILNSLWTNSNKTVSTFKTPTYLLLNEKREFEAFGYDAEKRYTDLYNQGRHARCFFFRRFKTKLHGNQPLTTSHVLKDETGRGIPAIKVFSLSIRYLKGHLLNALRMRGRDVATDDIKWVITVPAVWSDVAKQFMRQAAIQAGIPGERLKLALEPEVASVYCQCLSQAKGAGKLPITVGGAKYILADLGGGMSDVVFHERRPDGKLRELNRGGGCMAGGGHVDNAFLQLLVRLLGAPTVREFLDECKHELLELLRDLDAAKRLVTIRGKSPMEIKIPTSLHRICKQKTDGDSLDTIVSKSVYREKVKIVGDKMHIDSGLSKDLFRGVSMEIAQTIRTVLADSNAKKTHILILVGGFADSTVVQDIVKNELEGKTNIQRIIVPPEPEIAVLKGAVLFGHQPGTVFSRVIRYTYGLRKAKLYNPDLHAAHSIVCVHGVEYVTDIFSPFITAGTRAPVGFMSYDSLTTIEPFQKTIEIDVYYSTELRPNLVTDKQSWLLGKIDYQVPKPSKEERTIYIEFIFGDTELIMNITDRKTATRSKNTFPILDR